MYNERQMTGYLTPLCLEAMPTIQIQAKIFYNSLKGARVNLAFYPQTKSIAGLEFEVMMVVRIRRS